MKISIVIPAKNEGKTIGKIIKECKKYGDEIVVIDGHSTDDTKKVSLACGAVVYEDHRKGKGEAIRTAIKKVKGDIVVFIDADGSHDPKDIPKLVAPIIKGKFDHVVASRGLGGSDELHGDFGQFIRMVGSEIITLGINYRFNVRLTDSQNGFRALLVKVARKLDLKEDITTIEQEITMKTLKAGYRMGEVSSHEYERITGKSKVTVGKMAWRYFYTWLKYLFF